MDHKNQKEIGAFEAKTHLSKLLDQVDSGEVSGFIITKHGKAIAKLVPVDDNQSIEDMRLEEAIEGLEALSANRSLNGLDWKELRDEGRRFL